MNLLRRTLVGALLVAGMTACTSSGTSPAPTPGSTSSPTTNASSPPFATVEPAATDEPTGTGGFGTVAPETILPGTTPATPPPIESMPPLAMAALRYRLVDELGRPLYCDPDYYPIARDNEAELAAARYPAIRADTETYLAIAAHLGISPSATPDAAGVLAVYRERKMLAALDLQPAGGAYRFDYIAASAPGASEGWHVFGSITSSGSIRLELRDPSGPPPCPICLARGTLIETPSGPVQVADLLVGAAVWTSDAEGRRIVGYVAAVATTPVPPTHRVVHLVLADGRVVNASPGHPLADGRQMGELRPGDRVDGGVVISADLEPYAGGATFDLLPSGPTGTYWANGILLGSTLGPSR